MRAALLGVAAVVMTSSAHAADVSENFDGAAALPSGWTTTGFTIISGGHSEPNRVFVTDPAVTSNSFLNTPTFEVTGALQVRFRNFYATQASHDGGILEVSYDDGPFQEVTSAGGTFVAGGYNGTLDSGGANPLAGSRAWTGSSGGFIATIVDLPAAPHGQVRIAFHFGSDGSGANVGWSVDDFELLDGCRVICPENVVLDAEAGACGAVATYAKAEASNCGAVLMFPPSGSFFDVGPNTVTAISEAGAFCELTVTVADDQPPSAACPSDIQAEAEPGVCAAPALFVPPAGIDNCAATTQCDVNPGDVLPGGTTVISCVTTDGGGRSASCSFNYTVTFPEQDLGDVCSDRGKKEGCAAADGVSPLLVLVAAIAIYCRLSRTDRK